MMLKGSFPRRSWHIWWKACHRAHGRRHLGILGGRHPGARRKALFRAGKGILMPSLSICCHAGILGRPAGRRTIQFQRRDAVRKSPVTERLAKIQGAVL